MRKYLVALIAAASAAFCLQMAIGQQSKPTPRVLVPSDLGSNRAETVAKMEAMSWTVGSMTAAELLAADGPDPSESYDVIWILPDSDYDTLRLLSTSGGLLDTFARAGGTVVMVGLSDVESRADVTPGGMDCKNLANAGDLTIDEPNHGMIAGSACGGTDLTCLHLDPDSTGGGAALMNAPEGSTMTCIVSNSSGTVVCEYALGQGRVLASLLDLTHEPCLGNVVRYIDTISAN